MEEKIYLEMEEVIDAIRHRICQGNGNEEHACKRGSCAYCGIMEIMSDISSISAADVQPVKHGRWELIGQNKFAGSKTLRCTHCKSYFVVRDDTLNAGRGDANFCPNCGARMDFKEENNYAK